MRQNYPLSDQTLKILSEDRQKIADEMDVDVSYLGQINRGVETDPFAKFKRLFSASVRAGRDVSPWMLTLEAIIAKYTTIKPDINPTEALSEKLFRHTKVMQKMLKSIEDGHICPREAKRIVEALDAEEAVSREIRTLMQHIMEGE